MNSMQLDRMTELAQTGADYARADNRILVMDYRATLRGWFECATYARDGDSAQAAIRATEWIDCASDYCRGRVHPITGIAASLMWGEGS